MTVQSIVQIVAVALGSAMLAVLLATAQSLVSDEAKAWLPYLSRSLIRRAASRLPDEHVERYREEWLAELSAYRDRPLTALVRALGILRGAYAIREALSGELSRPPLLERVLGAVMLVVLGPLVLWVAVAIKLESKGPAMYRAPRGLQFRTVHLARDPQVDHAAWQGMGFRGAQTTRVGGFLLRLGIHEASASWTLFAVTCACASVCASGERPPQAAT